MSVGPRPGLERVVRVRNAYALVRGQALAVRTRLIRVELLFLGQTIGRTTVPFGLVRTVCCHRVPLSTARPGCALLALATAFSSGRVLTVQSLLHGRANRLQAFGPPELIDATKDLSFFVHDMSRYHVHHLRNGHSPLGGGRVCLVDGRDQILHDHHIGLVLNVPVAQRCAGAGFLGSGRIDEFVFKSFVQLQERPQGAPLGERGPGSCAARITLKRTLVSACMCLNSSNAFISMVPPMLRHDGEYVVTVVSARGHVP